ncbi:hypothetical protein TNIN_414231 [Trichonephila inaurata madagascariensis]|uniref:Uncharacterized protein n=1 Tax=Trichonephila inaurata madagascariensis TaxID=2747483 RepID=A0A8X7CP92_9ARAC|nr:hypothetical protein TNIN_414231 [Trichonephila inaurata madagascariensis]
MFYNQTENYKWKLKLVFLLQSILSHILWTWQRILVIVTGSGVVKSANEYPTCVLDFDFDNFQPGYGSWSDPQYRVVKSLILNLSLWVFPVFRQPCDWLKDLEQWQAREAMWQEKSVERISIQCRSEI